MKIDKLRNRKLLVATKHGKEQVIAPVLQPSFKVECWTPADYDTDILGTFSGEIERQHDPLTTARIKCLLALEKYNLDLGIASEGSFGPHPEWPFVSCGEEILILLDKKNNFELFVRDITSQTNFSGSEVQNEEELHSFAASVLFPSHGLIMKDTKENFTEVRKGITDRNELISAFLYFMKTYGRAFVETDMRAHVNPTRMKAIGLTSLKLAEALKSGCPRCSYPGFIVRESKPGLPCKCCNTPTAGTLSVTSVCQNCGYAEEKMYPNQKKFEEPGYCDICNP